MTRREQQTLDIALRGFHEYEVLMTSFAQPQHMTVAIKQPKQSIVELLLKQWQACKARPGLNTIANIYATIMDPTHRDNCMGLTHRGPRLELEFCSSNRN